MNKSERFFTQRRRVTKPLWFSLGLGTQYDYHQDKLHLKTGRAAMFKLSTCVWLIPVASTVHSPVRSAHSKNPIEQLDDHHQGYNPAVSSLGASPTPAQ
ncbi:hypothetical protein LCGC14_1835200 [marine sediment metagenome]|uniref:Uncharacterized protein n=1 Tax=marine sediment metagenome TaxID=412755 RepID=A0A0F9H341_9ZZZZ